MFSLTQKHFLHYLNNLYLLRRSEPIIIAARHMHRKLICFRRRHCLSYSAEVSQRNPSLHLLLVDVVYRTISYNHGSFLCPAEPIRFFDYVGKDEFFIVD